MCAIHRCHNMVESTIQEDIFSTSRMIVLTYPLVYILPNRFYSVPIRTPLISTIAPHTILHSKIVCSLTSPILLTNVRFQAKPRICNTAERIHLLPYFNISCALPCPTILVGESSPKWTYPPPNFSHLQNQFLCNVI